MDYTLFEARPGISVLLLPDEPRYTIVAVSHDFLRTSGMKRSEVVGRSLFEIFPENPEHPEATDTQNIRTSFQHVLQHKEPHRTARLRYDTLTAEGTYARKYWKMENAPVAGPGGEVRYIIHTSEDITTQVNAEQRLESFREMETAYRLFMLAPVIINILRGSDYIIELANEGMLQVWGKGRDVIGKPLLQVVPELAGQGFIELMDNVRHSGQPYYAYEVPATLVRQGKAELLYFDIVYQPFYENGSTTTAAGVISVAHDVTSQVEARRLIEESRQDLQLAIEVAELGTFQVDLPAYTGTYSKRVMDWFGFSEPLLDMHTVFGAIHPDDQGRVVDAIQHSITSEEVSRHDVTYRVVHPKKGTVQHLRSIGKAFFNNEGKAYAIRGIIQDVTPQVEYQQKMEESEALLQQRVDERTRELESLNTELKRSNDNLEEFAYAASHDMKEPIRKINFFADRLQRDLGGALTEDQARLFERMQGASRRMATLIDDLLTYSHISKGVSHTETVDLNVKVQMVLEDLELEIEEKEAAITTDRLPTIRGHKRQMQQLFQNLIGNALKYSQPGVPPEIRIRYQEVSRAEVPASGSVEKGAERYHQVEISDNGIGFSQEDADRIFNVFTRLHGHTEYKGSGVGLSIARKVAANHGGLITAQSAPGAGATFRLLLPVE